MNLPSDTPRLPKWIFIAGDAALVATAWFVGTHSDRPAEGIPLFVIVGSVVIGAVLGVYPFVVNHALSEAEALDNRQRALEALAATVAAAAEQVSIAATGLQGISEAAQDNFSRSERLSKQIQEKISELDKRLTDARREEALATAKLETVSTAIASSSELASGAAAKLQGISEAAQESFGKSERLSRQIQEKIAELDKRLADARREEALAAERLEAAAKLVSGAAGALEAAAARPQAAAPTPVEAPAAEPAPAPSEADDAEPAAPVSQAEETPAAEESKPSPKKRAPRKAPVPSPEEAGVTIAGPEQGADPVAAPEAAPVVSEKPAEVAPVAEPVPPVPEAAPVAVEAEVSAPVVPAPESAAPAAEEPKPAPRKRAPRKAAAPEEAAAIQVAPAPEEPAAAAPEPAQEEPKEAVEAAPVEEPAAPAPAPAPAAVEPEPSPAAPDESILSLPFAEADKAPEDVKPAPRKRSQRKPQPAEETPADSGEEEAPEPAPAEDLVLQSSPQEAAEPAVSADGATRLIVTAYIGIGNRLFIRGEGPGLSWEKGVPLTFVSIGKWRWETSDATAPVAFKLYKNDQQECTALGLRSVAPGAQQELSAAF